MAQNYNIKIRRYNGTDFDTLLPQPATHASTHSSSGSDPLPAKSISGGQIADNAITSDKITDGAVSTDYTVTVPTGWGGSAAPFSQSVNVQGIKSTDNPIVDIVTSQTYGTAMKELDAWSNVYRIITANNSITLYASEKPTIAMNLRIKCIRK